MSSFQICQNTSDTVLLYLPQQLYLKPIAKLNISLQLPRKTMGKSISNWEAMDKLRYIIKPEQFISLKVSKVNLELIRFEAELDEKSKLSKVIDKLHNKHIQLKDFPELLRIKACEIKVSFPTRQTWDEFFHNAKDMNELKPGERPDTLHISNLPIKWFVPYHLSNEENIKPSEKIFYRVFEKFGQIRRVDIPICDPYRKKMKNITGMQVFSFDEEHFFEGYVQFKDYIGFTKAMEAFSGMKLLHKEHEEAYTININVDFDKSKHLCDASVRRREIVRERLVRKELDKEEKLQQEKNHEEERLQHERLTIM